MNTFPPFPRIPSPTHTMSLNEVVRRLAQHPVVEGVLLTGSTAGNQLAEVSDYDLVLFLEVMPVDLRVAVTSIDGRLTDLVFYKSSILSELLQQGGPLSPTDQVAPLLHWLRQGRVAFDRHGRLERAKARVKHGRIRVADLASEEEYHLWYKVNYNLRQAERIVGSSAAAYQLALRLRLLYSFYEVWLAYVLLRGVPWRGDKTAIRSLEKDAPDFLGLMQEAILETDLPRKVALYRELAMEALAPAGGLWEEDTMALRLRTDEEDQNLRAGLTFWQELIAAQNG